MGLLTFDWGGYLRRSLELRAGSNVEPTQFNSEAGILPVLDIAELASLQSTQHAAIVAIIPTGTNGAFSASGQIGRDFLLKNIDIRGSNAANFINIKASAYPRTPLTGPTLQFLAGASLSWNIPIYDTCGAALAVHGTLVIGNTAPYFVNHIPPGGLFLRKGDWVYVNAATSAASVADVAVVLWGMNQKTDGAGFYPRRG